jgi:hypothetical protein
MPTLQGPDTNRFRCEACGRFFNTEEEMREHQRECVAAQQTGSTQKTKANDPREGEDREWVSTP